jgi:hypothetical protein
MAGGFVFHLHAIWRLNMPSSDWLRNPSIWLPEAAQKSAFNEMKVIT